MCNRRQLNRCILLVYTERTRSSQSTLKWSQVRLLVRTTSEAQKISKTVSTVYTFSSVFIILEGGHPGPFKNSNVLVQLCLSTKSDFWICHCKVFSYLSLWAAYIYNNGQRQRFGNTKWEQIRKHRKSSNHHKRATYWMPIECGGASRLSRGPWKNTVMSFFSYIPFSPSITPSLFHYWLKPIVQ